MKSIAIFPTKYLNKIQSISDSVFLQKLNEKKSDKFFHSKYSFMFIFAKDWDKLISI